MRLCRAVSPCCISKPHHALGTSLWGPLLPGWYCTDRYPGVDHRINSGIGTGAKRCHFSQLHHVIYSILLVCFSSYQRRLKHTPLLKAVRKYYVKIRVTADTDIGNIRAGNNAAFVGD